MNMKIEELEIGDMVTCKDGKTLFVESLDKSGSVYCMFYDHDGDVKLRFHCTIHVDQLCPVELTEEFLEHNGITRHKHHHIKYLDVWESGDGRISVTHLSNTKNRDWCIHIGNEDFVTIGSVDIQYVHELQHILRLLKIECLNNR